MGSNSIDKTIPHISNSKHLHKQRQGKKSGLTIYFSGVSCKFGMADRTIMGIFAGLNRKGGRNDIEVKKYVKNSILPLYPDAVDLPEKHVFLIVDSGPSRLNFWLLAKICLCRFICILGCQTPWQSCKNRSKSWTLQINVLQQSCTDC